jgi:fused-like protein
VSLQFVAYLSPGVVLPLDSHPETSSSSSSGEAGTVSVLQLLISYCEDPEPAIRKFACFAVGNASFHSNELYPLLVPAVRKLSVCLEDVDGKTRCAYWSRVLFDKMKWLSYGCVCKYRANAAGAVGNLVRNGGYQSPYMANSTVNIPQQLLKLTLIDRDIQVQRTALFSLGTMAVYPSCRFVALALF